MKGIAVSDDLKTHYGGYYESEDPKWRRLGAVDKALNIVSLCGALPHTSILEVGAGDGAILERLAELNFGHEYHALEISPSAVAAITAKAIPGLADCRIFDGYELPYKARIFDLAVLSHVLEHVEYPRRLLYEASRVATHVFVEVPLEDTLRLGSNFIRDSTGHINEYSARSIRRLIQTCNLVVMAQVVITPSRNVHRFHRGMRGIAAYYAKATARKIWPTIATHLFTYHSALVCRAAQ